MIERNSTEKIVLLGINEADGCVTGSDIGQSEVDYEKMERERERALEQNREPNLPVSADVMFGITEELPFDSSGRFIIPPFFREEAGLTDLAFFLGRGDHFAIWNPQRVLDSGKDAIVQRAVRSLLAQRGIA
ncbi:MraZ C-terminal domain-containing protein [Sphingomonas antarctica]|uniref:MraZ C-terminal domain-containing protein n=1 Tax=Sphingomonas antarctica TaxID=2040274 RepID=UPI0039ECC3D1